MGNSTQSKWNEQPRKPDDRFARFLPARRRSAKRILGKFRYLASGWRAESVARALEEPRSVRELLGQQDVARAEGLFE